MAIKYKKRKNTLTNNNNLFYYLIAGSDKNIHKLVIFHRLSKLPATF